MMKDRCEGPAVRGRDSIDSRRIQPRRPLRRMRGLIRCLLAGLALLAGPAGLADFTGGAGAAWAEEPSLQTNAPQKTGAAGAEADKTPEGLLEPGTIAPDFTLPDGTGASVRLADLLERPLLLYFYPKDDTPGCTKEACAFRDDYAAYEKAGVRVVGISTDSAASHAVFAAKWRLPFTLLSDESGLVARAYGVAFTMHRGDVPDAVIAKRTTYLIGTDGKILHVWPKVEPAGHSAEILRDLPSLLPATSSAPAESDKG